MPAKKKLSPIDKALADVDRALQEIDDKTKELDEQKYHLKRRKNRLISARVIAATKKPAAAIWRRHKIENLPISDYSKGILARAELTFCAEIPDSEAELMAMHGHIGFAVLEDLKKASKGKWPFA